MALQRQFLKLPLKRGIDTKTDPKQGPAAKLQTIQNGTFVTPEQIRKRNGYQQIGVSLGVASAISAYQNELVAISGPAAYSYSVGSASWGAAKGITQPQLQVTPTSVFRGGFTANFPDTSYHSGSGLQIVSWVDTVNGSAYSIIDYRTGQQIVVGASVPNCTTPVKTLAFGNYLMLIYYDSSAGHLRYRAINVTTPTVLPAAVDLATNIGPTFTIFDAAVINSRLYVFYNTNVGGGRVSMLYLDTNLNPVSTLNATGEVAHGAVCLVGDASNNVWVAYHDGTNVRLAAVANSFGSYFVGPLTVETIGSISAINIMVVGTTAHVYYSTTGAVTKQNTVTTAAAIGTPTVLVRSVQIASKAISYQSNTYFLVSYYTNTNQGPTYFLYNASQQAALGKLAALTGAAATDMVGWFLPEVPLVSTGVYQLIYLKTDTSNAVAGGIGYALGVMTAEMSFLGSTTFVEQATTLHMSGALVSMYDGAIVCEHGFNVYPDNMSFSLSNAGGSIAAGTYDYCYTFEWVDNNGQVHRSAPSFIASETQAAGSTNSATATLGTLRLTQKTSSLNPVQLVLYRTTAGGSIFYKVGSVNNSTSVDTLTITDRTSDSTLVGNAQLYTSSGEVENISPPAALAVWSYRNRVCLIPADSPYSWWFSKEIIPASAATAATPVEFSDLLIQNETQVDGPFVVGHQMDDKNVLFKTNMVYYTVGSGPASDGSGEQFPAAQQIVTDTGCNNAASIVLTPDGLMYQSPKGIYLLDRSLKDHYVGIDVEAYNSYTVTSAVLVQGTTQVRFTLSNGQALVYDYGDMVKDERGFGQWSVFTNVSAVGATNWQGLYTYVTSGGNVYQEDPGVFTDAGTGIQLAVTTRWLSFAEIQGFQRVYKAMILGDYESAHTLRVQVAYDFDSTVRQTDDITASSTAPYQYRINLARQKCEAVQLTVEDLSPTGESMRLSSFGFEVGIKSGPNRLAPTRSFG